MKLYTPDQVKSMHSETLAYLIVEEDDHVLHLTLNREQKKNALHPQLVNELAFVMHYAHFNSDIWMLTLSAKGTVFCAGADLKAMAGIIEENNSTIPQPNGEVLIGELFNTIHKPIITKVQGDVYAGGFFFLAGSHIVISQDNVKFGLPEVKRGLYPFQVMQALLQVMPARKVIDWCIRGYNLPVKDAAQFGLVTQVCAPEEIDSVVQNIIKELKQNSPSAIRMGLESYSHIQPSSAEHKYLFDMLQKTITSADGIEGLKAFREKRRAIWTGT